MCVCWGGGRGKVVVRDVSCLASCSTAFLSVNSVHVLGIQKSDEWVSSAVHMCLCVSLCLCICLSICVCLHSVTRVNQRFVFQRYLFISCAWAWVGLRPHFLKKKTKQNKTQNKTKQNQVINQPSKEFGRLPTQSNTTS